MAENKTRKVDLEKILEDHKHWLSEDCPGYENMCANLSGADLRGVDLSKAKNVPLMNNIRKEN